jgi:hypothetical protein
MDLPMASSKNFANDDFVLAGLNVLIGGGRKRLDVRDDRGGHHQIKFSRPKSRRGNVCPVQLWRVCHKVAVSSHHGAPDLYA